VPALEAVAAAIQERALETKPLPEVATLAQRIASVGGDSVRGIVFFGSRKTGAAARDAWSAYDLFVITRDYGSFYARLAAAGHLRRSPALVAALNRWLPPNQVSLHVTDPEGTALHAKCAVIAESAFLRDTAVDGRRDHFCAGRLFQPTEIVYSADARTRDALLAALASAHVATLGWIRPWLPERFDAEAYCRTLLSVSLSREIRPEPSGRAEALWVAQEAYLRPVYATLLRTWAAEGQLAAEGQDCFRIAAPVTDAERRGASAYFRRSKRRATLRWAKYVVTFEDWLDYIVKKVERHTGETIALTARERRWPLVFLWPRVFRYLRGKDRRA
jgi:predicted nucleotidyltransferase